MPSFSPREIRLMKNRMAARECRKKKKEYIKNLENTIIRLEKENADLRKDLEKIRDTFISNTKLKISST